MKIDTNTIVSISDANKNFSKVTRIVDEKGSAIIFKNNIPKYIVVEYKELESTKIADDEDVKKISDKFLKKNEIAYKELAKW